MSKIVPHDDADDTSRGELRKPLDWANQPEQGGDISTPNAGHANPLNDHAGHDEMQPPRRPAPPHL
jgi:hypothetical protein